MPTIKLQSSDGITFNADIEVIKCSGTIKTLLEECDTSDGDGDAIPLPNVHSDTLERVLRWADHHAKTPSHNYITVWEQEFLDVDRGRLFETILAAHYLDIKPLMSNACKVAAEQMKRKNANELRVFFNIDNCANPNGEQNWKRLLGPQ